MNYEIKKMKKTDWNQVKKIYEKEIKSGDSTFDNNPPNWKEWDKGHFKKCRLVIKNKEKIYGWAALSPVYKKKAYEGVAEVSIYIDPEYQGNGFGKKLLKSLIKKSEDAGFWTLEAKIFPENEISIYLHKKFGFRLIGIREKLGKSSEGNWRDVALLERRSSKF